MEENEIHNLEAQTKRASNGKFVKGTKGGPGRGIQSKQAKARMKMANITLKNADKVQEMLDKLEEKGDPEKYLNAYFKAVAYVIPQLKQTDLSTAIDVSKLSKQERDELVKSIIEQQKQELL